MIVRFSSPLKTGWEDMRDLAFTSDDAEVRQAFRVYGQKDLWAFLVYPREDDNTILVLEGARECSEAGAPCARGGRQLGNTLWIGIAGSDGEDATVHRLTIEEGGSFESQFESFHVRLTPAATSEVTVEFLTYDITATEGEDYEGVHQTLTFEPGRTLRLIPVTLINDTEDDRTEKIGGILFNAVGAEIRTNSAVSTITDND